MFLLILESEEEEEREKGRKEERERHIDVREQHWSVASHTHPDQESNPQLRFVPQLGI